MREIKFRGKVVGAGGKVVGAGGRWAYGSLIANQAGISYIVDSNIAPNKMDNSFEEVVHVGQYAGLKDHNEIEIFEGDIVRVTNLSACLFGMKKNAVVIFKFSAFKLKNEDCEAFLFTHWLSDDIEVIGNIHDNPELMKGDE